MNRKARFWWGLVLVVLVYSLPIAGFIVANLLPYLTMVVISFVFSLFMVYRMTSRNIKPRYPIVNPEGHPDIYSGRMPRPIYEDMRRYPWFFSKKKQTRTEKKKMKKEH